jgi:FKBP-type peptidyl-prolyl cis-trans isomerase FkpA
MRVTLPLSLALAVALPLGATEPTPAPKPAAPAAAQLAKAPAKPAAKPAAKPVSATPAAPAAPTTAGALQTEDDKTIYALGLSIWRSLQPLDLNAAEVEIIKRALADAAANKPEVSLDTYGPKIDALGRARVQRGVEKEKVRSQEYLTKMEQAPGAVKAESGLIYFETQAGTGASPQAADTVKVHYRGTLVDGTEFDSSHKRGEPAEFPLGGVIRCWTEGVQKMKVGGKAKLICPAAIAYGDRGRPSIPGGAALTFEIELLEVKKAEAPPAPPAAPTAPAAAPAPAAKPSPAPTPKP